MASFNLFFPILIRQEGGYTSTPHETYEGIDRVEHPEWDGWAIVDQYKPLHQGQIINDPVLQQHVIAFYKPIFWDHLQADGIQNQSIANFLADWGVNANDPVAARHAQMCLGIAVDGVVGPNTLNAINSADGPTLFNCLKAARIKFYHDVVALHPEDTQYLDEWIRRTNSFLYS